MLRGTLRPPPSNKKKIIIIVISVLICLAAAGAVVKKIWFSNEQPDGFGPPPRREWTDTNMPNPQKQTAEQILAYIDSDKFKSLSDRERFIYMREGGQKVMEYHIATYFSLPDDKKTAYLDQIIDRMEDMRRQMPRPSDANDRRRFSRRDPNDPNRPQFGSRSGRQAFSPANMRAMRERGTPLQTAQRRQFMQAIQKRMQQRGITTPSRGGGIPRR